MKKELLKNNRHEYSTKEIIKDVKKTVTITTTAFATILGCLWLS